MRLAILGASGHIGKNLTERFCQRTDCVLYLFARDSAKMQKFCTGLQVKAEIVITAFAEFERFTYDAVINCIGVSDPGKRTETGAEIFRITEEFDNLVLNYLSKHTDCRYINMSSGAVYGADFSVPADDQRKASYLLNPIHADDYYSIAKLNAEAKHRAYVNLAIVDLRVFGFFSKHIDIRGGFLLADAARCLLMKQRMKTGSSDMIRDYVYPDDLFRIVELCTEGAPRNIALDVYSAAPVNKFTLLDMLHNDFCLEYVIVEQLEQKVEGEIRNQYFSVNRQAQELGYKPLHSSLEVVQREMSLIIARGQGNQ